MKERRQGHVTLHYSPESEAVAGQILGFAAQSNEYLARLFKPDERVDQAVYWMARKDWRGKPDTYGFPNAGGADAYLAAADVDLPTQLALIADFMGIQEGGPQVERMARLLGLPAGAGPDDVHRHLKESKPFFVIFTAYFIMPHELTHGYCNALEYPQKPRWCYEGIAQWAAYHIQKDLRSADEAEMMYEYYQFVWDRGTPRLRVQDFARADEVGAGELDTPNYAWYHGGLLRMFRELEEMKGADPLPGLIPTIAREYRGQRRVSHADMIKTFSDVIGRDLTEWFRNNWRLGPGKG